MPKSRAVPFRSRHMKRFAFWFFAKYLWQRYVCASHRKGAAMASGRHVKQANSGSNGLAGLPILKAARHPSRIRRASPAKHSRLRASSPPRSELGFRREAVSDRRAVCEPRRNAEGVRAAFTGAGVEPLATPPQAAHAYACRDRQTLPSFLRNARFGRRFLWERRTTCPSTSLYKSPRQSRGLWIVSRSKRHGGVANAAPIPFGHLVGGRSSPQVQLVQALVLLLLVPDVLVDHRLVPTHR